MTGARLPVSYWLHYLIEARLAGGQKAEGLEAVDEALALTQIQLDDFYDAELYRLRGELLLLEDPDYTDAETCFQKSLELAKNQHAKMFELRATMSLSRLLRAQGKVQTAQSQLAEIIDWFSEGFDTRELQGAKTLLAELS